MNAIKRQDLEDTYQTLMEVCSNVNPNVEDLDPILLQSIVAFGTTADERIFSKSDFYAFIKRQEVQSQGLDMQWQTSPIVHRVSKDENSAVFIDDLIVTLSINDQPHKLELRCSVVFEYQEGKWFVVHMHASKPEEAESETDTFGIEQWKQKTKELEQIVAERTADLIDKNNELETAIATLKSTQAQLIQSEKMASLGELTAGIAHEIQNPLNFVNNFSEVSNELIDEILEEREKKNEERDEALVGDILEDIKQNLEKINHHGKRADGIVKGMLQHSRSSSGKKELTDINSLTDEYLRLAYHGLRAKDKSFNANLETDYDNGITTIDVVPQDVGRVILNLFTNAFYAVDEKKSHSKSNNYKPTVSVSTKKLQDRVEICVKDNGNGIPKTILDKIFQPFFTTKPTGKGTGLGLSMSYDIIQAHNGELQVETGEGQFTAFKIILPITKTTVP
ncbi:ATP-binding protein [Winogradskyella schleiferi]|uniref:ATP-binding protein n=1 Tax=Winogradskyella schleiferi TaxID=2686078 RepID=UPI0015B9ACCA|nr:ATP-binding protein [Winogradskyella schleiferi]